MRKTVSLLLTAVLLSLALSGCAAKPEGYSDVIGLTDDWIYVYGLKDGERSGIWSVSRDGKKVKEISGDYAAPAFVDDWLVYYDEALCRVNTKGKSETLGKSEGIVLPAGINGDDVYWFSGSSLQTYNTVTKKASKVCDIRMYAKISANDTQFVFEGSLVFFNVPGTGADANDTEPGIYVVENGAVSQIYKGRVTEFVVCGSEIYCTDWKAIHRVDLKGSHREILTATVAKTDRFFNLRIAPLTGQIFFCTDDSICVANVDGSGFKTLLGRNSAFDYDAGWLYYCDEGKVFRLEVKKPETPEQLTK